MSRISELTSMKTYSYMSWLMADKTCDGKIQLFEHLFFFSKWKRKLNSIPILVWKLPVLAVEMFVMYKYFEILSLERSKYIFIYAIIHISNQIIKFVLFVLHQFTSWHFDWSSKVQITSHYPGRLVSLLWLCNRFVLCVKYFQRRHSYLTKI